MDLGLRGVHVLVTGASGGIGLETIRLYCSKPPAFAALGANVTAHYNSNVAPIKALLDSTPRVITRLQWIQADLSREDDVKRMFASLAKMDYGPVQIVIVNHGYWPPVDVPLAEMSLDQWNSTLSTNLTSSFLVCREYLKELAKTSAEVKDKASIVLIGSTAGKYGEAGHVDYSVTKSAMMYGLTMTLKNEIVKIAPKGRVNCVAPGWVKTPMAESALSDPQVVYRALATTPLKKVASPLDIANQIAVLSSSTVSGHVTGQVLMVEGGMEGRLLNKPEDVV
ncbi:NAD(P)-binding protein [Leucogyrophana mollusca]|uniref:NAD(P)-binding protein n=1 Tax=Leucogyrophana mollusca TaxID=85980 RepID=A0ACB8BF08_9AGAM|nr:NAD(P)-binding protein [Leucogyrophana mollusca]